MSWLFGGSEDAVEVQEKKVKEKNIYVNTNTPPAKKQVEREKKV